ncbi:MAG TPA: YfiR family protein [Desulfobulbus sp.]|nr:YfiR family protein [Desulfobulbus sp.]
MHKLVVAISLFLLLQVVVIPVRAEAPSAKAPAIEAAFLVKFTSYVKWPSGTFSRPDAPVVIGIFGRDPFGSVINTIARSYTTNNRHVEIRRCTELVQIPYCNIVFIAPSAMGRLEKVTATVSGQPILLVGDSPGFLARGGMVNFVMVHKRIRFDISRKNCKKAGLEISSKLLKVAHAIR